MYNNLLSNWEMNPLKSIIKNFGKHYGFVRKKFSLDMVRDFNLSYLDLYTNKNGKICGKDSAGNNLYFPYDIECPINRIFISDSYEDLPGYKNIQLNTNSYLFYTNQFTEGKIVIDLKINSDANNFLASKEEGSYFNLFNIPFYEKIDSENDLVTSKNEYLYSINYLGINISSFSENIGTKIKKMKDKFKLYFSLNTAKIFMFFGKALLHFLIILFFLILVCNNNCCESCLEFTVVVIFVLIIIIDFTYITISILCLIININYVTNFISKINFDFERKKKDFN